MRVHLKNNPWADRKQCHLNYIGSVLCSLMETCKVKQLQDCFM